MTRTKTEILQELKQASLHIEEPSTSLPHSRKLVIKVPGDSPVTADEYMIVIQELV
ncbi:hypothetical protein METP3_03185 [Methanosarcinales archaeon]|nr:hypothetical protein METP3_03185 [Methanosarcinales archaeon]